jgi:hypothetical protein
MALSKSHSMPSQIHDEYGIGVASDSDEEAEHVHSAPNLALQNSSAASSLGRSAGEWAADEAGSFAQGLADGDLHLFFIWVDPSDPCADRLAEWPLPQKYLTHVRRWEERYQVSSTVVGGSGAVSVLTAQEV